MSEEYIEITEAEAEYLRELREEIEGLRKKVLRYKIAGVIMIALGVYFLFLALLLVVRPLIFPWNIEIIYAILIAVGSICFALGLYLFSVS